MKHNQIGASPLRLPLPPPFAVSGRRYRIMADVEDALTLQPVPASRFTPTRVGTTLKKLAFTAPGQEKALRSLQLIEPSDPSCGSETPVHYRSYGSSHSRLPWPARTLSPRGGPEPWQKPVPQICQPLVPETTVSIPLAIPAAHAQGSGPPSSSSVSSTSGGWMRPPSTSPSKGSHNEPGAAASWSKGLLSQAVPRFGNINAV